MLKLFSFLALVYVTTSAAITTPVIVELKPQPSLAPANTKHAGYVESLTAVFKTPPLVAISEIIPFTLTSKKEIPYPYDPNYLSNYTAEDVHYIPQLPFVV